MSVSVCIPNYNYEQYLGRTLQSVLDQTSQDFEIVIADNASTDNSVQVAEQFQDERIRVKVNACNVGFAGNLDRAGRMATRDTMLMLSSDDLMRPNALETYEQLLGHVDPSKAVISATADKIDPDDKIIGSNGRDTQLWLEQDRNSDLEATLGVPVYQVAAAELLRRCLATMKNPFNFLATAYPRGLYEAIEGYGGGRLMNPDKWFHWRLLTVAGTAYYIDAPLFAYRWHDSNQTALQAQAGALKYLVDEYTATLQLDATMLDRCGLQRSDAVASFIEYDIARHGLATLARGNRPKAKQILTFGRAVYPSEMRTNSKVKALAALLALGPIGKRIAARLYRKQAANTTAN